MAAFEAAKKRLCGLCFFFMAIIKNCLGNQKIIIFFGYKSSHQDGTTRCHHFFKNTPLIVRFPSAFYLPYLPIAYSIAGAGTFYTYL